MKQLTRVIDNEGNSAGCLACFIGTADFAGHPVPRFLQRRRPRFYEVRPHELPNDLTRYALREEP